MNPENNSQPTKETKQPDEAATSADNSKSGQVISPKSTANSSVKSHVSNRTHAFLVSGLLLVVALLLSGYFMLFTPTSPAEKFAIRFMDAASSGNADELVNITQEQDTYVKQFLTSASVQLKGSYKLLEKKQDGTTWYFLYEIKDAPSAYARLIIDASSTEKITSLVFLEASLDEKPALVPTDFPKTDPTNPLPAPTEFTSLACLEQKDYAFANTPQEEDFIKWSDTYEPLSTTANKASIIFFDADTAKEESVMNAYDNLSRFNAAMGEKQWTIRIRTTYNAVTAQTIRGLSDYTLAKQRAQRAKNQLLSNSIQEARILVEEPTGSDLGYSDENESVFRKVEMVIDPTCSTRQ
jgi:outer membrane protein OmpA-like peptidoglycan-associated protein